jgi:putative transcriptional regulator
MRVLVNLNVMLARRRMSLSELSEKVSISISNLSMLKSNKARGFRFATMAKICEVLECQPGDLLECISNEEYMRLIGSDDSHKWEY